MPARPCSTPQRPLFVGALVVLAGITAAGPAIAQVTATGAAGHQPRRALSASPIQLVPPDTSVALLSRVLAAVALQYRYTGSGHLAFSLVTGPAGMTVEPDSGIVKWTPAAAAEGSEVGVRVRAGDGTSTAEVAFTLRVASTQTVGTTLSGPTVTVAQAGTLQGLALTFPAQTSVPLGQVAVSTISAGQAPPLPDGVTRISDFFRVTPVQATGGMITVTLPVTGLPAGRKPQELRLFVYSDAAQDAGEGGDIAGPFWIRTWYNLDVLPNGKVTIALQGLGELSFIGLDAPVTPPPVPLGPTVSQLRVGALTVTTSCSPLAQTNGLPDLNRSVCTVGYATGKSFVVTVKNFADFHAAPAASLTDLLGWLAAGRTAFDGYGLLSDPAFEVVIEAMPAAHPNAFGFVTTNSLEDRRVLHLTRAAKNRDILKGTAVHEYFHHAQSRTKAVGKTNLMDTNHVGNWLIEGLARWLEDEVFDTLNTYRLKETLPLQRILKEGVAAIPNEANFPDTRAYVRWAFWKMVALRCSGFSIPEILNVNAAADPTGIANFKEKLESAGWQCDFGAGFGDANRATLADALLYYSYATEKEDSLALLDANEPYTAFAQPGDRLTPSPDCTAWDACPAGSLVTTWVNRAGVDTYRVNAVSGLTPGQTVAITVESVPAGRELWVWSGDNEKPGGLTTGAWYRKTSTIVHTYVDGSRAPETMLFVVNPDPTQNVHYRIRASIANTFMVLSMRPIILPGSPGADLTVTAMNFLPWPASYKVVWSFNDGTPDVTVENAATVTHRWPAVGDWTMLARLYSLPDNTLRAQAEATARIRYFHGDFQLSQFTGSHSGCFWDSDDPATYAKMAANPAATELYLSFAAPQYEAPTHVWLYYRPDATRLWVGADDPTMTAPDCPHELQIVGNTLRARYANGVWGNGAAATCMEVLVTQVGGRIEGTFTHRDTVYQQDSGGAWHLFCRGDASYSFLADGL